MTTVETLETPSKVRQARAASMPSSLLTEEDLYLFNEGSHLRLYDKLGSHSFGSGTAFAVWAPNAREISVIGDFNDWDPSRHPLSPRGNSGIWEGVIPNVNPGALYKYHLVSRNGGYRVDKTDPFAFHNERAPRSASVVWELDYDWGDGDWMRSRERRQALDAPVSIYEMHLGSWRRHADGNFLSYREIARPLADYVLETGFTHVQFLPLMEHPFYGSWGYQTTGYFAPTSRYGTPQDLMTLIDYLHQRGIGVILDWVPSHFPTDAHGLAYFDGTHLFEHADPRQGFHPDWQSAIFNYGRREVQSFLLSSAGFWLDKFHADGLRVDAVASMLYLDYSRKAGEWIANPQGGRENLEAIGFLSRFNKEVFRHFPGIQTIAEESTAWPMVSRPTFLGGLGFGYKWDMGWMHDTLSYFSKEPVHRKFHHNNLTFRMLYAFTENFVLALSHDEVVHGKGSLLGKMPGDDWQRFANLRLLLAYMTASPGKKSLFMGAEFGAWREWNHDASLDWGLLNHPAHAGVRRALQDLNRLYRAEPALHARDCDAAGFSWIDCCDSDKSVISFLRRGKAPKDEVIAVFNFTPVPRENYRVGVPDAGRYRELFNSDAAHYGGSNWGNFGGVSSTPIPYHGHYHSIALSLPPLGALFFKREGP